MQSGHLFRCNKWIFLLRWFSWLLIVTNTAIASELTVTDAWVRLAPPTASVNAAYMSLHNTTSNPIRVIDVSADCCAMASFHQTVTNDEIATMKHLDEINIPAHSTVVLAPGDLHIMLMKARHHLKPGEKIYLDLTLDTGVVQQISARVKSSHE